MSSKKQIWPWAPVILYAVAIFYVSSLPVSEISGIKIDLSLVHIPEFFLLSYLVFNALSTSQLDLHYIALLSIIISTLYGVTDELHQIYVPGRYFSFSDILFNFIGSSLILFKIWKNSYFKRL